MPPDREPEEEESRTTSWIRFRDWCQADGFSLLQVAATTFHEADLLAHGGTVPAKLAGTALAALQLTVTLLTRRR